MKPNVLILGVFRDAEAQGRIHENLDSQGFPVEQFWIREDPRYCAYDILNELIRIRQLSAHRTRWHYLGICADDVGLPSKPWLKEFLWFMRHLNFNVAQGARTKNAAHIISLAVKGSAARLVRLIETGPLTFYDRKAAGVLLPLDAGRGVRFFDTRIPYGFDVRFAADAKAAGLRLGMIDAIRFEHLRPYGKEENKQERKRAYLRALTGRQIKILPKTEWQTELARFTEEDLQELLEKLNFIRGSWP